MDLNELRGTINDIDEQLLALFEKRMEVSGQIAEYKLANDMKVFHPERERQVIERIKSLAPEELKSSAEVLFTNLMDISKCKQFQRFFSFVDPFEYESLDLSGAYKVAVPGTTGSYSQAAAKKFLPASEIDFYDSFAEVFAAVECKEVDFGVVPIANSTAGTVSQTYDLMRRHDFHISASTKVAANHCIAVKPETDPSEIRRVLSHEQALMQCSKYLSAKGYSTRPFENTALAAVYVKESEKPYAAICSEVCANEVGLKIVDRNIANAESNFTRFILFSRTSRRLDDADIISVSLTLPHQTSALYRLLTKFSVAGLNLTKLESRPIANTDFDVLFYLDFEGSVDSPDVVRLIRELKHELTYFKYLGNFKEIM